MDEVVRTTLESLQRYIDGVKQDYDNLRRCVESLKARINELEKSDSAKEVMLLGLQKSIDELREQQKWGNRFTIATFVTMLLALLKMVWKS